MATTINASTSAGLVSTADTSGVLQLQAQGTTVLNGELGKALALQGATSTTGCGIAFPATQVASTNANTLDDYSENTFTPTFVGLTVVSGTPTYAGTYTKIGRLVFVSIRITGGASTTSVANTTYCNNLPFAASVDSTCQASNSATSANYGVGLVQSSNALVPTWTAQTNVTISMTYQV